VTTDTLWSHPWAFALIAAALGFAGQLMFYTSEEGAAAMFGLAAGVLAYVGALLVRVLHRGIDGGRLHRLAHRSAAGTHRTSH
jgi:hypothetical protein